MKILGGARGRGRGRGRGEGAIILNICCEIYLMLSLSDVTSVCGEGEVAGGAVVGWGE